MKKKDNYFFPDTEKVGQVIFHYSKRINGSFVETAKADMDMVVEKLKRYRNINLKSAIEANPIHIYIYPDIKSFRSVMGAEMTRVETRQAHFAASKSIETRYILTDEFGNIHMVLPQGRTSSTYTTFSSELVTKVVCSYINLDAKKEYELKNTVKKYIKSEREAKLKEEQDKLQEELERQEQEERERAEQEEEEQKQEEEKLKEEEELQKELEEMEEEEREKALLELQEIDEEEISRMAETQTMVDNSQDTPAWMVYGWRAYICNRLANQRNIEKFKKQAENKKLPKPTSIKGEKIESELDLNVACATVEYVVNVYGYRAYQKLCEDPENIKGALYPSTVLNAKEAKNKFNKEVKEYIYSKLEQLKLHEITVIEEDKEPQVIYAVETEDVEKKIEV